MEYVMVEMNFTGSDNGFFQAFKIQQVESQEQYESLVKNKMTQELEKYGEIKIFSDDIHYTSFDSVENIWPAIRFQKVTQEEVNVMKKLLGRSEDNLEHGPTPDFFRYDTPKPVVKIKM